MPRDLARRAPEWPRRVPYEGAPCERRWQHRDWCMPRARPRLQDPFVPSLTNGWRFSRGRSGPHRGRIVPRSGRRARRLLPLVRSGLATDCRPLHSHLLTAWPQPAPAPRPRRRALAQMGRYLPRAWRRRGPTETSAHPPTPDLLESAAPSPTCHSVQAPRQPRRRGPKRPQVDSMLIGLSQPQCRRSQAKVNERDDRGALPARCPEPRTRHAHAPRGRTGTSAERRERLES